MKIHLIAIICGSLVCVGLALFVAPKVIAQTMTESQQIQLESLVGLVSKIQGQVVDLQNLIRTNNANANTSSASSASGAACGLAGGVLKMDITARVGMNIYTKIRECCSGLTKLPIYSLDGLGNCKSLGSTVGNGNSEMKNPITGEGLDWGSGANSNTFYWSNRVCAIVGDGICGTGENKCNSADCKTATAAAGYVGSGMKSNETCYVSNGRSYLKHSSSSASFYYGSGFDKCCIGRNQNNCTTLSSTSSCGGIASIGGCDVNCKPILKCTRSVANGSACNKNVECKSGNCAEGVCCNDSQCGWGPAYGGTTRECVNDGEQRSSDSFNGVCTFSEEYGAGIWVAD